jgi:hypothetical protein
MALTTEREATLIARFDMLFTEEMKRAVKYLGGAGYLRQLVLDDITRRLSSPDLDIHDSNVITLQAALAAELERAA